MKNKFLLLALTSLTLVTAKAGAATSQQESETVPLPAFVVEAPRQLPVEKAIQAGLDEVRNLAHAPAIKLAVQPSLSAQSTFAASAQQTSGQVQAAATLAKL